MSFGWGAPDWRYDSGRTLPERLAVHVQAALDGGAVARCSSATGALRDAVPAEKLAGLAVMRGADVEHYEFTELSMAAFVSGLDARPATPADLETALQPLVLQGALERSKTVRRLPRLGQVRLYVVPRRLFSGTRPTSAG